MDESDKAIVGAAGVVIPALWKGRELVSALVRRIVERLLGRRERIAVTGCAGVGKSVLLDSLSGEARSVEYDAPTSPSLRVETGRVSWEALRASVSVVPGQPGPERLQALESLP